MGGKVGKHQEKDAFQQSPHLNHAPWKDGIIKIYCNKPNTSIPFSIDVLPSNMAFIIL